MRTVSVLQKVLGLQKSRVVGVRFDTDDGGELIVFTVQLHQRSAGRCPHCQKRCGRYDQRGANRRWRHLDLGGWRCFVEMVCVRVSCPSHGVVTESVPWARAGARMTRAFDDQVAWLVAHSPMSSVQEMMRVSWATVSRIVDRVVADHLGRTDRLNGLRRIGIDEISYRKGRRYLLVVVDHDTGRMVWAGEGATKETLNRFFDELGPQRTRELTHVSADGADFIATVLAQRAPEVYVCMDPFHVLQWVSQAMDRCRSRVLSRIDGLSQADRKRLRWALLKNPEDLTAEQEHACQIVITAANDVLARAYQLKELLRQILTRKFGRTWQRLRRWLAEADNSGISEMQTVARSVRAREIQIYNAVTCEMSNGRVEANNTHLRALTKRSYGFHSPEALIAMATLTRGGACPALPQQN
ncbi:ISL3 family transposase [Gordonia polyisoprenivorans]|uniref:ISL3 family transposase n=1 Tax=Gordonia polyisoprenivorans TaxID=84595 RepID=UPI000B99D81A|nr:ISL3 family transposase [Gordonia polyisoprenivorans]